VDPKEPFMPLRNKLLLSMAIPALLLVVVAVVGITSLHHLEQAAGRILSNNYQSIQEARTMERSLRSLELFALSVGRDIQVRADEHGQELAASFDGALEVCEGNITEPGEPQILREIRSGWAAVQPVLLQGEPLGTRASAALRQQSEILYRAIEGLVSLNEQAMVSYERDTVRVGRLMVAGVGGAGLAALLALGGFAVVSARRISTPVIEVADRLHRALNPEVANGTQRTRGLDEIERLRSEMNALLERLALHEAEQTRRLGHLQERLALVMDKVLEGLVLLDESRRIIALNRIARTILHVANGEGMRLSEIESGDDVRKVLEPMMTEPFQEERDLGELRHEVDRVERVYRPRVVTLTSGERDIEGYLLLFWDVTEQRRLEESQRRFIAMLSHQLKTPMTSLSMSVNLLSERLRELEPAEAELIAIARESCQALSSLTSELIDAARDVAPGLTLHPRRVDIVRLLRSALHPLVPQAQEQGVDLVLPDAERSLSVVVDPVKFPWVVTNIAGNALRHTGRGGRVEVQVERMGETIQVNVIDTGRGIVPEDLDLIFRPYVSLDRKPSSETHGLGLAVAKEIVEAHHGSIEAQSEPGKGTRFRIRLLAEPGSSS
jgi:NtrC-family two-component system sensor histidine kinase KinB